MVVAKDFKKGMVITLEGSPWIIEDYHIQKTAQRRPVLHVKLRNMKTRHVVDRTFDEADQFDQPDLQSKPHQYLFHDKSSHVFMDSETFEQVAVPEELVGTGKWLLKEGAEFLIRFFDGAVAEVVFPPNFMEEVTDTAEPSSASHANNVMKDATLACGLVVKVPLFIRVGDQVKVDTATHKYMGKEGIAR
jgi:elongation factor P